MSSFINKLFATKPVTRKNRRRTLSVETLTDRTLMAASITASLNTADGILRIEGTYGDDQIHIRQGLSTVRIDGVTIVVTDGESTTSTAVVQRNQVAKIIVAALDGNDRVEMHDAVVPLAQATPMVIHGASGNDTLIGGKGADIIYGESGVDSVLGGAGKDTIYGDANPAAAQVVRAYGLEVDDGFTNWLGKNEKWLLKRDVGQDVHAEFYITPDGGLYEYSTYTVSTGQSTITNRLLETFDPSYHQDIRKLEAERGLYNYDFYYGIGNRDEKLLIGIGNPLSDGWYFITPTGELFRWDGKNWGVEVSTPINGELIAALDFSYLADPFELVKAATDDGADDQLNGQDGDDYIDGGAGHDFLKGVQGNDTLIGSFGNDVLAGFTENDLLDGGDGDDSMWGEGDHDTLIGSSGNDTMSGWTGNDSILGGAGNDTMMGDAGLDVMYGGDGSDTMRGGTEKDIIAGENDNDLIYGDAGNDELIGCFKGWHGETGNANDTIYGGSGADSLYGGDGDDLMRGEGGSNFLYGEDGWDTMFGSSANDTLIGGAGSDSLTGWAGDDVIYGEDGSDRIFGNEGRDTLVGGNDNDWIDGGDNPDVICGAQINWAGETGFADDTLHGAGGNDTVWGGIGTDQIFGEAGDDWLNGEDGRDWIYGGKGNDCLDGGAEGDVLWGGEQDNTTMYYTGDSDTMFGGAGNDWFHGGGDRDSMQGGAGNDTQQGGYGRDTMWGEDDVDHMVGGPDNDTMGGGRGNDSLWGNEGNDELFGDEDDDQLDGGDLRDTLSGGQGRDAMFGGAEWDTFRDDLSLNSPFFGQNITDIDQEASPTCATFASIAAALRQGHDFRNQITVLGNNLYRVRLFPNGRARDVTVFFDGTWTDNDGWPSPDRDYWALLLHRAHMQLFGIQWNQYMNPLSWEVEQNNSGRQLFNPADAMMTLSGRSATHQLIANVSWQSLADGLALGSNIVASTPGFLPAGAPLVGKHAYAVIDAYVEAFTGRRMLQLYNPHGNYVTVTWDEFAANIAYITRT